MTEFLPEQIAENPFWFRDCFLMTMPIGQKAINLRELLHVMQEVNESVLYYHLLQSRLAVAPPVVEYPNDFALWAATALQDTKLAEKLSSFDPFDYDNMAQVREAMVDHPGRVSLGFAHVPWARSGFEFHFCEASMVVIRSEISAANTPEGVLRDPEKGGAGFDLLSFFRGPLPPGNEPKDDFSYWIETNFGLPELVAAIRDIDIYFYSLERNPRHSFSS